MTSSRSGRSSFGLSLTVASHIRRLQVSCRGMVKPRRCPQSLDTALLATKLDEVKENISAQQREPEMAQPVPGSSRMRASPARRRRSPTSSRSRSLSRRRRSPARRSRSASARSRGRSPSPSQAPARRATPARSLQPPRRRQPRMVRTPSRSPVRVTQHRRAANAKQTILIDEPQRSKDYQVLIMKGDLPQDRYAHLKSVVHALFKQQKGELTREKGGSIQLRGYGIYYIAKVVMQACAEDLFGCEFVVRTKDLYVQRAPAPTQVRVRAHQRQSAEASERPPKAQCVDCSGPSAVPPWRSSAAAAPGTTPKSSTSATMENPPRAESCRASLRPAPKIVAPTSRAPDPWRVGPVSHRPQPQPRVPPSASPIASSSGSNCPPPAGSGTPSPQPILLDQMIPSSSGRASLLDQLQGQGRVVLHVHLS